MNPYARWTGDLDGLVEASTRFRILLGVSGVAISSEAMFQWQTWAQNVTRRQLEGMHVTSQSFDLWFVSAGSCCLKAERLKQ